MGFVDEKISRLSWCDEYEDCLTLIYMWVKQKAINKQEFIDLINYIQARFP